MVRVTKHEKISRGTSFFLLSFVYENTVDQPFPLVVLLLSGFSWPTPMTYKNMGYQSLIGIFHETSGISESYMPTLELDSCIAILWSTHCLVGQSGTSYICIYI